MSKEDGIKGTFEKKPYDGEPGRLSILKQEIEDEINIEAGIINKQFAIDYLFSTREYNSVGEEILEERFRIPNELNILEEWEPGYSTAKASHRIKVIERNEKITSRITNMKSLCMKWIKNKCSIHFSSTWSKNNMDARKCWTYLLKNYGDASNGAAENTSQVISIYDCKFEKGISFQNFYVEFRRRADLMGLNDAMVLANLCLLPESTESGIYFMPPHMKDAIKWVVEQNLDIVSAIEWFTRKDNYFRSTPEGKKWIQKCELVDKDVNSKGEVIRAVKRKRERDNEESSDSDDTWKRKRSGDADISEFGGECYNCKVKGHPWRRCSLLLDDPDAMIAFQQKIRKSANINVEMDQKPKGKYRSMVMKQKGSKRRMPLRKNNTRKIQQLINDINDSEWCSDTDHDEGSEEDAELPEIRHQPIRKVNKRIAHISCKPDDRSNHDNLTRFGNVDIPEAKVWSGNDLSDTLMIGAKDVGKKYLTIRATRIGTPAITSDKKTELITTQQM